VTGGGRGIGRSIALELAGAGMQVAVSARSGDQVREVAGAVGGLAIEADVSSPPDVERMVAAVEGELGPIDLLVNNAGIERARGFAWEDDPEDWWHVFEVNVRGPFLCCRAVLPGMVERGRGRIVNVSSGAAYLPVRGAGLGTAYGASKAALSRFSELLAHQTRDRGISVFHISPGLVRTSMTEGVFGDDAPWTPPELAPRLVRAIAEGRLDPLSGRYLHAEHDPVEDLARRTGKILESDLNAIRLRR
jgi:NAD(P)-dependent dehydrogenase (short-subunit alcohol dehydrogenase family)